MTTFYNRFLLVAGLFCIALQSITASASTSTNNLLQATAREIKQAHQRLELLQTRTDELQHILSAKQPATQMIQNFDELYNTMKKEVIPVLGSTEFTAPETIVARGAHAIRALQAFVGRIHALITGQSEDTPPSPESPAGMPDNTPAVTRQEADEPVTVIEPLPIQTPPAAPQPSAPSPRRAIVAQPAAPPPPPAPLPVAQTRTISVPPT